MEKTLDNVVVEQNQSIEDLAVVFSNTLNEIRDKELLSPEAWEDIFKRPEEIATLFERFLAKKSNRLSRVYFKKLPDKFKIKELSGTCPSVDYVKRVRLVKKMDWETDIISMLGGNTNPTPETKVEVYEAKKEMSIYQAYSRLSPNYELAALSKAQIRYFCLHYHHLLKDQKNNLVFLLKKFYPTENGESSLMGIIVRVNDFGIHISIQPEQAVISSKKKKEKYFFIVPLNTS